MEKFQSLFESVFKRNLADKNSIQLLKDITDKYPYFSVAQFYLLQLSEKGTPDYKKQAQKTAALFNNNYWLNYQLQVARSEQSVPSNQAVEAISAPEQESPLAVETGETEFKILPYFSEIKEPAFAAAPHSPAMENAVILEEQATEAEVADMMPEPVTVQDETTTIAATTEMETTATEPATDHEGLKEEVADVITETTSAETIAATAIPTDENLPSTIAAADPALLEPSDAKTDEAETLAAETGNNALPDIQKEEHSVESTLQLVELDEGKQLNPGEKALPGLQETETANGIENEPAIPQIRLNMDMPASADAPLFEPLHTTDYFASVGIKLSETERTGDKLGKQLKSFTEWLKTMKKIHAEQPKIASSEAETEADNTESGIQKLAEISNQENEVLTEAMAEVLLQQGKAKKAVELLEKLSLLNPGKSAYFAAKINQIK